MFHKPTFPWQPEETQELRRLHSEGHTYAVIADKLNGMFKNFRTRMSISGKASSLGLTNRDTLQSRKPYANKGFEVQSKALEKSFEYKGDIDIMQLKTGVCHWPGNSKPQTFCGKQTNAGCVYCPEHMKIAFQPKRD